MKVCSLEERLKEFKVVLLYKVKVFEKNFILIVSNTVMVIEYKFYDILSK